MTFDIGQTASSVYGIVGTGISLGVLAGTAGMVMRSMERNVYGGSGEDFRRPYSYMRRDEEEYQPRPRTYQKRKTTRKQTKSKKRKTTRRDEYEERPRYGIGGYSPYGSTRLNIPRYW